MIKKITDKSFWLKTGREAKALYRKVIFEKGQNVFEKDWWNGTYSKEYEIQKASGKIKRSASAFRNKVTPVLTSDLFKDFKKFIRVHHDGVEFGFVTYGKRVKKLRDAGDKGTLTSKEKPLPDTVKNYILKEYNKYIKRNQKPTTRIHKIGKK